MPLLAATVLLKSILHDQRLVANILPVHDLYGAIARRERRKLHKPKALTDTVLTAHDVGRVDEGAEAAKRFVQQALVDARCEVAHKEIGADGDAPSRRRLRQAQRLAKEGREVEDCARVGRARRLAVLNEGEALVLAGDAVARHVDGGDRAAGLE